MSILFLPISVLTLLPLQIILIFFAAKICSMQELIFIQCSKNSFDSQSPYEPSINQLFSSLIPPVPHSSNLYLNKSVIVDFSSSLYGLAGCRPDYTPNLCFDCLSKAASLAIDSRENGGCHRSFSAALRLAECLLLYSDQPNLAFLEWGDLFNLFSSDATASAAFTERVKILVRQTAMDAANARSMYAVSAEPEAGGKDIYVMAWCRLDPFGGNCAQCLQSAIDQLTMKKLGGLVAKIGCLVRFDIIPFFHLTEISSPLEPKVVFGSEDKMTTSHDDGEPLNIFLLP